jgi:RHS repeat-associated protein
VVTGNAAPYTHHYFHANRQGSVIAMSDDSGAKVEGPYVYDPYGDCFSGGSACSSSGEPYRFAGRRLDPETGLLYYRARYYWPQGGRFLQTDPVGYDADLNLYAYVGNDPIDREDALGLCDDVTGCRWSDQAQLNTPEARQAQAAVMSAGMDVVGAYLAPGKVALGTAIGGVVGGGISALRGGSAAQIISDAKAGAFGGATTSAGGAIGGKGGKITTVGGEIAGAFTSAKASGSNDTEAGVSAAVAGVVGAAFQIIPGLAPSANEAASGAGSATRTILRSLLKSGTKAELKSLAKPQSNQQKSHTCTGSRLSTTESCTSF